MKKVCWLINDKFSWILEVDNMEIPFHGSHNANYFADLYDKLGYEIKWNKDKYKQS